MTVHTSVLQTFLAHASTGEETGKTEKRPLRSLFSGNSFKKRPLLESGKLFGEK